MSRFFLVDTVLNIDGGTFFDGHEVMTENEINRFNLAKKVFGGETIEYIYDGYDVILADLTLKENEKRELSRAEIETLKKLRVLASGPCPTDYVDEIIENAEIVSFAEIEIDGIKVAMIDCLTENEFVTSLETKTDLKYKPSDEILFRELSPEDAMKELLEHIIL